MLYQETRKISQRPAAHNDGAIRQRPCAHAQGALSLGDLSLAKSRHGVAKRDRDTLDQSLQARSRPPLRLIERQGKAPVHKETLECKSQPGHQRLQRLALGR
jgi:hypothetical protein